MGEGKFGFLSEEDEAAADLALQFEPTPVRRPPHAVSESDRSAAEAGFVSREANQGEKPRRRRLVREPATRSLAIRMTEAMFARFLRYADRHELTYSDAIANLLDLAGEPDERS